jgi:hypothetical protein
MYVRGEFDTLESLKTAAAIDIRDFGIERVVVARVMEIKINFDDGLDDSIIGSLP